MSVGRAGCSSGGLRAPSPHSNFEWRPVPRRQTDRSIKKRQVKPSVTTFWKDAQLLSLSLCCCITHLRPSTLTYITRATHRTRHLECSERHTAQLQHNMSSGSPSGSGYASPSNSSPSSMRRHPGRPQYMTVGNGSTSEHAARLAAMLDNDSGYGGSIADGTTFDPTFDQDPMTHL